MIIYVHILYSENFHMPTLGLIFLKHQLELN
jgi:hypothetical protein